MNSSYTSPGSWGSTTGELADLKRRVADLESANQLGSSAITDGALLVKTPTGVTRVRLGKLAATEYGLEVTDLAGRTARVDNIALGSRSLSSEQPLTVPASGGTWHPSAIGPELTLETSSGAISLMAVVAIEISAAAEGCIVGTEIMRPDGSVAAPVGNSSDTGNGRTHCYALGPAAVAYSLAGHWDLVPGTYRLRCRYWTGSGPSTIRSTTMLAFPF